MAKYTDRKYKFTITSINDSRDVKEVEDDAMAFSDIEKRWKRKGYRVSNGFFVQWNRDKKS